MQDLSSSVTSGLKLSLLNLNTRTATHKHKNDYEIPIIKYSYFSHSLFSRLEKLQKTRYSMRYLVVQITVASVKHLTVVSTNTHCVRVHRTKFVCLNLGMKHQDTCGFVAKKKNYRDTVNLI